jgi:hypothetical protein
MNDPEVARLRRLRSDALRVREIALALGSTQLADDRLLERGACTAWRIARVVSGRLNAHPYLRYQKGVSLGTIVVNRLLAAFLAATTQGRLHALKRYETEVHALVRRLDDTRALIWSSDFSDTLGRAKYELDSLLDDLAPITETNLALIERLPKRAPRNESLVGDLARIEGGDWPYLAF